MGDVYLSPRLTIRPTVRVEERSFLNAQRVNFIDASPSPRGPSCMPYVAAVGRRRPRSGALPQLQIETGRTITETEITLRSYTSRFPPASPHVSQPGRSCCQFPSDKCQLLYRASEWRRSRRRMPHSLCLKSNLTATFADVQRPAEATYTWERTAK